MLNKIIVFSIRNKLLVGLFILALVGYGVYEATRLPIDAVPDITNNQVQVITVAPSFGATDIERLVTFPVEQATSNIPGMIEMRSFSRFGLSLVTLVFNDNTDVYWARQQVSERIQIVKDQIPDGVSVPELGPVSTGLGEIYQYVVRASDGFEQRYSATELRTIQDWIVRRQLMGVEGVAEVSSFGGKLRQFGIEVDPSLLNQHGLTIHDVFTALERNNQNTGGAYIERGPAALFIRTEGLIGSEEDIRNTIVRVNPGGSAVYVRDVAEVKETNATRFGAMCYNDKGEVAGAVVMMLKGANSGKVIRNVKERIEEIQKMLPEGVIIEPFLDRSKMVGHAIGTVEKNLAEGALIVVVVLVLFLGNFRAGLLVASVIPLAMLFAIIMMNIFGVSGNLMSLGALDFGLIVDGAVIIVESVMHQLSQRPAFRKMTMLSRNEMDDTVAKSAGRMMNSAVFGQVIILIVYLPIFSLQGIEGKMFRPMAQTVAFALLGAFILSLTYIPMMSAWVLSRKPSAEPGLSERWMVKMEKGYQKLLGGTMRFSRWAIAGILALFVAAVFLLTRMGGEFIPALEEGDFAVDTRVLTGSSLNTTIESTQKAVHILLERFPEVEKIVTKIGSGEVPTDPMPMEASDMMIILKDKKEWTSASSFDELAEKMGRALEEVPGITAGFQYPVQMRFNELMTGARQDVVCKIFGENLDTLAAYADRLGAIVQTVDGAMDLYIEPVTGMPQIVVDYDRTAIAHYRLHVDDINRVVQAAFAGVSAGFVYEGERRFDLVVRLKEEKRGKMEDVRNLLIPTPTGEQVPLYLLAKVDVINGPNQIQREDAKRRIVIGFNVGDRDVQSIVQELQTKVEKDIRLPAGYSITYGGAFENLEEAKSRLMFAVPVSLALIFIILYFAFGSVRQGLLIYSAIPLSAIGGIFFLSLRGMPFSISAGVGFIALFGVAVLNGIVLVAEFNRLRKAGMTDLRRVVITGAVHRLRPVLMTACVASLGFLPMALSNGAGAEVQKPLATVVIGGLMIATLLTLFILPILYAFFEGRSLAVGKGSAKPFIVIFCIVAFGASGARGQLPVGLRAAIDSALQNNLNLRSEQLQERYVSTLAGTSWDLPSARLSLESGEINSSFTDHRIGLSQSLRFPTVYARERQLWMSRSKLAMLDVTLKELELKRSVALAFNEWISLKEREKLLLRSDSLYEEFAERARIRFEQGETSAIEKITAESQRGSIGLQLNRVRADMDALLLQFQMLLNSEVECIPEYDSPKMELFTIPDSAALRNHVRIQRALQQQEIADRTERLERSRFLPDLDVGAYSMTMIGTGADDVVYSSARRFNSIQAGIGIPVFSGAQRARVRAAQLEKQIAENEYSAEMASLVHAYEEARMRYKSASDALGYYEKSALPDALDLYALASDQLQSGEINYLEWVTLVNQSIAIESNYLDALRQYNVSAIQLQYVTSTK